MNRELSILMSSPGKTSMSKGNPDFIIKNVRGGEKMMRTFSHRRRRSHRRRLAYRNCFDGLRLSETVKVFGKLNGNHCHF